MRRPWSLLSPLAVLLAVLAPSARSAVLYVNANAPGPTHDGTSWAAALTYVTPALAAAHAGDEIWVAAGTYQESITLKDRVGLYGGFAGTEDTRGARDPATHTATLQGTPRVSVVTVPADAGPDTVLDGFTITGGGSTITSIDADGVKSYGGGGIFCLGSAVISHNVITGNFVQAGSTPCGGAGQYGCLGGTGRGGGIYCAGGAPIVYANRIEANRAETDGGGVFCGPGSAVIDSNTIVGNKAYFSREFVGALDGCGAGISCEGSNALVTRNVIQGSTHGTTYSGEGIYSVGGSPVFSGNSITGNEGSTYGGGVYLDSGECSDNLIRTNSATAGGGVYATGAAIVSRNIIDSNSGTGGGPYVHSGGGVFATSGATVASNLFTNNTSASTGGGCYATGAEVYNNTFVRNTAKDGGALAVSGVALVANNIVSGNTSGLYTDSIADSLAPYVRANDVFGNRYSSGPSGTNVYEYGGTLPAQTGQRGNISADPLFVDATAGNYRLQAGSPCVNAGDDSVRFLPADLDGKPRSIGAHIDIGAYESGSAAPIPRILRVSDHTLASVPDGVTWATAYPTVQAGIDAASPGDEVWIAAATYLEHVTLKTDVALYGGFLGTESFRSQRNTSAHASVLDGSGAGTVVIVPAGITEARLDGFTVRNGAEGGVRVIGDAVISGSTIEANRAATGGGVRIDGTARVESCLIRGNSATGSGGGLAVSGDATLVNDTIAGNSAASGAGLSVLGGSAALVNSIVAFNASGVARSGGTATLSHSDVFGNTGPDYAGLPDPTGIRGNIATDPLFTDRPAGDYHLQAGSPCVDAGDDTAVSAPGTDLEGNPRLLGAHVDMGAYERGSYVPPNRVVYVNRNAVGGVYDGASWGTAFRTVQAGIDAAGPGGEVWVAASAPTLPAYVENVTLTNGVALYGGFAGAETSREQRDPVANPTILDGNHAGRVVTVPSSVTQPARLDGFVIRNGSTYLPDNGGGIGVAGNAIIANNTITGNRTESGSPYQPCLGGGIYVSGNATITGNTISRNYGDLGGGIYAVTSQGIRINGNVITQNSCHQYGSALNIEGSAEVAGNTISRNGQYAIVVALGASGTLTFVRNLISENAGPFTVSEGHVVAADNVIYGNSGALGTLISLGGTTATVANNTICGNEGDQGVLGLSRTATIVNNLVAFNRSGVVRYSGSTGTLSLRNNDVYGNTLYNYSGMDDPTGSNGNISADPLLSSLVRDIHLQPGSPCIDAGDGSAVTPGDTDAYGKPRVLGAHVDIGADESDGTTWVVSPRILRVAPTGADANDGSDWSRAKRTVDNALAASMAGDEVWVAQGMYVETVMVPAGVALYGGFAGAETVRSQRDFRRNASILDGNQEGLVVSAWPPGAIIDGLTIRNGTEGGILISGEGSIVANCIITGNSGEGGIRASSGVTISGNTVSGNASTWYGGGISTYGNVSILGNVIAGNTSGEGGGIRCNGGRVTLVNNTICGNTATSRGGGVWLASISSGTIANSIVAFNNSGIGSSANNCNVHHTDVYGNTSYNYSGLTNLTGILGNIGTDPLFVNRTAGDFHLRAGSPCIDAGDDSVVGVGATDRDGNARRIGAHVDMGAYEFLTPGAYTLADVARAMRLAGGLLPAAAGDLAHLNVEAGATSGAAIGMEDAVRLAREAVGLDQNPLPR